jgi:hypothetical protein
VKKYCESVIVRETGAFKVLQKKNKSDVFEMYGCIDHAGNLVIKPRFKFIGQFHDGLAVAELY